MKALVTGATGFVGPHLLAHLQDCGDDVVLPGDASGSFDITDRSAVQAVFEAERPEVVYHLAAWSDVGASWIDPDCVPARERRGHRATSSTRPGRAGAGGCS